MSVYLDYERDGMSKLTGLAKALCRLVTLFEPIIRAKFADKPHIIALLDGAKTMCALLPDALGEYADFQAAQEEPLPEPSEFAGTDPDAPEPVAPDIIIT